MNVMRLISVTRASKQCAISGANVGRRVVFYRFPITHLGGGAAQISLSWLLGLALICGGVLWTTEPAAAQSFQVFVPMASTGVAPTGLGGEPAQCDLNEQEAAIAQLMETDPNQHREHPICD